MKTERRSQTISNRYLPLDIWLCLLAVYTVWGSTYLAIRIALGSFPPFLLIGSRFLVAGTLLFAFLQVRGKPMPTCQQWLHSAIVGALLLGGGMGGVAFAEQWVSSSLTAALIATGPIWNAIFFGFFGQWLTRSEWFGVVIGFVGVGVLSLEGGLRLNPIGLIALVLSTMCWAFGSVLSQRLTLPIGAMGTATEMLTGGLLLLLLSWVRGEHIFTPVTLSAAIAWSYLVVFGSLIAFCAYIHLLGHARPAVATSFAYVNPIVALILGTRLAGEKMTWIGLVGITIVLAGVVFIAISRARTTK